jgi:hypothetical protein
MDMVTPVMQKGKKNGYFALLAVEDETFFANKLPVARD